MTLPTALFMTVLSAGLLVLSIPNELMPLGSFSIGLIALAPLYLALLGNKGKARRIDGRTVDAASASGVKLLARVL